MKIPEAIVTPLVSTEEAFDTMLAIPLVRATPIESSTPVPAKRRGDRGGHEISVELILTGDNAGGTNAS